MYKTLQKKLSTQDGIRWHQFITKEIIERAEKVWQNEKPIWEQEIIVKYFHPLSWWRWYITEIDKDWIAFWMVEWLETEAGSVDLKELEALKIKWVVVERDLYFWEKKIKDCIKL